MAIYYGLGDISWCIASKQEDPTAWSSLRSHGCRPCQVVAIKNSRESEIGTVTWYVLKRESIGAIQDARLKTRAILAS